MEELETDRPDDDRTDLAAADDHVAPRPGPDQPETYAFEDFALI